MAEGLEKEAAKKAFATSIREQIPTSPEHSERVGIHQGAGGYEYQYMGDGSIKILKGEGAGTILKAGPGPLQTAYQSILHEIDTGTSLWEAPGEEEVTDAPTGKEPPSSASELVTETVERERVSPGPATTFLESGFAATLPPTGPLSESEGGEGPVSYEPKKWPGWSQTPWKEEGGEDYEETVIEEVRETRPGVAAWMEQHAGVTPELDGPKRSTREEAMAWLSRLLAEDPAERGRASAEYFKSLPQAEQEKERKAGKAPKPQS